MSLVIDAVRMWDMTEGSFVVGLVMGIVAGYKMTLCESYMVYGACPYGDTCYDSHGDSELRQAPQRLPDAYPQWCERAQV
jgi:hypothetical protein